MEKVVKLLNNHAVKRIVTEALVHKAIDLARNPESLLPTVNGVQARGWGISQTRNQTLSSISENCKSPEPVLPYVQGVQAMEWGEDCNKKVYEAAKNLAPTPAPSTSQHLASIRDGIPLL